MRVLVVDDEAPARQRLARMLARIPEVGDIAEADSAVAARALLRQSPPEVVLLDIHMPEIDGLTLLELEPAMPPVIFVTAYEQHAVRAFELAAVDYLLKPVNQARLEKALRRARALGASDIAALHGHMRPDAPPRLAARAGEVLRLFDPAQLTRIRAADKYAIIDMGGEEFVLDDSLTSLEKRLAPHGFVRVHRAELINLAAVRALHGSGSATEVELSDGQRAPVSRRLLAELKRRLGLAG